MLTLQEGSSKKELHKREVSHVVSFKLRTRRPLSSYDRRREAAIVIARIHAGGQLDGMNYNGEK